MNYDDIECPRCKTTKYRNPQLKLLVNSCGHPLCENCIELMFATGTAKCYQCPVPLKRGNFKRQLFQDSQVEKDVQVRRDILRKFNKSQDAFPSLRAYNDYLEKLETVIYNLANNIDIDDTNRLLDELRRPTASIKEVKTEPKHKIRESPYYHKVEEFNNEGPRLPTIDDKYLRATRSFGPRELAGGFSSRLAIERALNDAFNCLWRANPVSYILMEFKGKQERADCYEARDAFFACHEKQPEGTDPKIACKELFDKFQKLCGQKWTEHFMRKHSYLKFKDKLMKGGLDQVDEEKLRK